MFRHDERSIFRLKFAAVVALMIPVLVSPWLFAAVQPWAQLVCVVCVSVSCVLVLALSLIGAQSRTLPALGWVAIVLVLLGITQLVPLSNQSLQRASPKALEVRESFGLDVSAQNPISMNPARTRLAVGLLVLCVAVFLVSYRLLDASFLEMLMLLVAVNGACLTAYAFVLRQTGDEKVYGWVQTVATAMGPFVNRNNAAGFLLASAAASLFVIGLNLYRLRGQFQQNYFTLIGPAINPRGLIALVCFIVITYGVLMSQSRGALLSLVVGLLGALVLGLRREFAKFTFASIAVLVLVLVSVTAATGNWGSTSARAVTVMDERELAGDGRLTIWSGCVDLVNDFWLTGCGLGTFRDVFRLYDENANGTLATHAENTWIEMACVGGVIGVSLLLSMLVLLGISVYRLLVHKDGDRRIIGGVGVFFVLSQLVASQFDFGLSIPANLIQFAFVAGAISIAGTDWFVGDDEDPDTDVQGNALSRILSGHQFEIVLVGMLALVALVGVDMMHASSVETVQTFVAPSSVSADEARIASEHQHARIERAIYQRWDDAQAHLALAESNIRQYNALLAEYDQSLELPVRSVADLRQVVVRLRGDDRLSADVEALISAEPTTRFLLPALEHLRASREANCLIPMAHFRLHQLSVLDLSEEVESEHLSRAVWLWEGRRHDYFIDGLAQYQSGNYSKAFAAWQFCLSERSRYRSQIIALATRVAGPDQLIKELFPATPEFLSELISRDLSSPAQRDLKDKMIRIYDANYRANGTP